MLYAVDAFEKALHNMDGKLSENPWAGTGAAASGQKFREEMLAVCGLLPQQLNALEQAVAAFNQRYGTALEQTWAGCRRGIDEAGALLALPVMPQAWGDPEKLAALRRLAEREAGSVARARKHSDRLGESLAKIDGKWQREQLYFTPELLREIFGDPARWNRLPGSLEDSGQAARADWEEVLRTAERLYADYGTAAELLHLSSKARVSDLLRAAVILKLLAAGTEMEKDWFDVRRKGDIAGMIREASEHKKRLRHLRKRLLRDWEPGVMQIDSEGMLARFKAEYTGVFHRLRGDYKADMRQIRLLSRTVRTIDEPEVIELLQTLGEIRREQTWFTEHNVRLQRAFPSHYCGVHTDWKQVAVGLQLAVDIANQFPYAGIPSDVIEAVCECTGSIGQIAEIRRLADGLQEQEIRGCLRRVLQAEGRQEIPARTRWTEILEMIRREIAREETGLLMIEQLEHARKGNSASYEDLRELIAETGVVREEQAWFARHTPGTGNRTEPEAPAEIHAILASAERTVTRYFRIAGKERAE